MCELKETDTCIYCGQKKDENRKFCPGFDDEEHSCHYAWFTEKQKKEIHQVLKSVGIQGNQTPNNPPLRGYNK